MSLFDRAERFNQGRHVEDVAEALAIGLEQQRERRIARGDAQQIVRALAKLPKWRALVGAAARQQQSASRSLAKATGEERGRTELTQNQLHGFGRFDEEPIGIRRLVGIGKTKHESVVAPERFNFRTAGGADARAHRHGPGNVDAAAEGSENADAPVAEFVAGALDDDGAVIGDLAGRGFLIGQELKQILGRAGVEVVLRDKASEGGGFRKGAQFADQCADAAAEFERAAGSVAFPERHLAGLAGSGRNENAVVRDVLDAPGRGAEDEGLVRVRLEDHLLVEFADAYRFAFGVSEEDSIETAIRNGAGVENGEAGSAVTGGDDVANAVPGEAGAEFRELVGGVAAAEQVEHAVEGRAGQGAEGSGAANKVVEDIHVDLRLQFCRTPAELSRHSNRGRRNRA